MAACVAIHPLIASHLDSAAVPCVSEVRQTIISASLPLPPAFLSYVISDSSSRLLLEALRMIRSRQRQGRGDPQPASAAIMEGVWTGRWDPVKNGGGENGDLGGGGDGDGGVSKGHARSRSGSGDNPRCAVCLEEVGGGGMMLGETLEAAASAGGGYGYARDEERGSASLGAGDWTADIGSEEASLAETRNAPANRSFAYLPCGHRFHTHW